MSSRKDLTGQVFERLTVLEFSHIANKKRYYWKCLCECGNIKTVRGEHLTGQRIRSCGCLYGTHRRSKSPEYKAWEKLKHRCSNSNNPGYARYGGRGITVCDRWKDSFENFFEDMGERPSPKHSIDRIDNDGNYEKSNCRWGTDTEQMNNTCWNAFITWEGKKVRRTELLKMYDIKLHTFLWRIKKDWSIEEALLTPVR
jgi:hypothetical protein